MRIIILLPLQCHQQIPSFPPFFQHRGIAQTSGSRFWRNFSSQEMPNARVGLSGCVFQTPGYKSMQDEGFGFLWCSDVAYLEPMCFKCFSIMTFLLILWNLPTCYWAKAHFQTRVDSANSLRWGAVFAHISVSGNLTQRFTGNLSPESCSSTERRCRWFWWASWLLPCVCICPLMVWAQYIQ